MAKQPMVVIVVDDDPGFLKSVARLLSVHGFDVQTFSSAETLLAGDGRTAACMLFDIPSEAFPASNCSGGPQPPAPPARLSS
jgi:FixJ family two-component response regulator